MIDPNYAGIFPIEAGLGRIGMSCPPWLEYAVKKMVDPARQDFEPQADLFYNAATRVLQSNGCQIGPERMYRIALQPEAASCTALLANSAYPAGPPAPPQALAAIGLVLGVAASLLGLVAGIALWQQRQGSAAAGGWLRAALDHALVGLQPRPSQPQAQTARAPRSTASSPRVAVDAVLCPAATTDAPPAASRAKEAASTREPRPNEAVGVAAGEVGGDVTAEREVAPPNRSASVRSEDAWVSVAAAETTAASAPKNMAGGF